MTSTSRDTLYQGCDQRLLSNNCIHMTQRAEPPSKSLPALARVDPGMTLCTKELALPGCRIPNGARLTSTSLALLIPHRLGSSGG